MSRGLFHYLRYVLFLLAMSLLVWLLLSSNPLLLWPTVREMSAVWLSLSLLCIVVNFACAAKRYQMLAAPEMRYLDVMEVIMASFLLNYASMVQGLGIGAKVGLMKARQVPVSQSMAGISGEVAIDLFFTASVAIAFLTLTDLRFWQGMGATVPVYGPLLVGLAVLLAIIIVSKSRWSLPGAIFAELKRIVQSGRMHWVLLSTAGIWSSAGTGYYCLIASVGGAEQVAVLLAVAAICVGFITGLLSMIPGGLGVREITWAYLVSAGTFSIELAGLMAVIYRLLSIVLILVILSVSHLMAVRNHNA